MQIASPITVNSSGLLLVRSTLSMEMCAQRSLEYEWFINLRLFSRDRKKTQEDLGLSDLEFLNLLKEIVRNRIQGRSGK